MERTPLTKKALIEIMEGMKDDTPILFLDFTGETEENDGLIQVAEEDIEIDCRRGIIINIA